LLVFEFLKPFRHFDGFIFRCSVREIPPDRKVSKAVSAFWWFHLEYAGRDVAIGKSQKPYRHFDGFILYTTRQKPNQLG